MSNKTDPKTGAPLRSHTFDDIEEYDNNLPLWWQGLFYVSLLWGLLYLVFYAVFPEKHSLGSHEVDYAERQELLAATTVTLPSEDELRLILGDDGAIARGRELFGAKACIACHGAEGLGLVGPNLRDDLWIHGSEATDIFMSLYEGRANNMMPSQRDLMSVTEMGELTAFLIHWNKTEKANGQGLEKGVSDPIAY